jgi:CsbD-like
MKIIDSKKSVFCQWGSRALQQKARPASASVGSGGKLTDDDLAVINGRRDQLEGKIQERYGNAKD